MAPWRGFPTPPRHGAAGSLPRSVGRGGQLSWSRCACCPAPGNGFRAWQRSGDPASGHPASRAHGEERPERGGLCPAVRNALQSARSERPGVGKLQGEKGGVSGPRQHPWVPPAGPAFNSWEHRGRRRLQGGRGLLKHPCFLGLAAPKCPGLGASRQGAPQTAPASWDRGKDRRKPESNPGGFAAPTAGENQLGQGDFQWECLEFPNPLTPLAGLTGSCVPGAGSPGAARGGGQRRFPC